MNRWLAVFLIVVAAYAEAGNGEMSISATKVLCSDSWERFIEENVPTRDGQGHGPDVGSEERRSSSNSVFGTSKVFRDGTAKPGAAISIRLFEITACRPRAAGISGANEAGPSFAYDNVEKGSIEASGSGGKYQGRNETFWEHHGEAVITWGYGAPEMHCKKAP